MSEEKKHAGGRPLKFKTVEELQEKIDSQSGGITADDIQATGFYNPSNN